MYPCIAMVGPVRNLEITTWSHLFIFFVSSFHSISFSYFSYCFRYFAIFLFLFVFCFDPVDQILWCVFFVAKRSSSRAAFASSYAISFLGILIWPGTQKMVTFSLSSSSCCMSESVSIFWVNVAFYCQIAMSVLRESSMITCRSCFLFSTVDRILRIEVLVFFYSFFCCYHSASNFFVFFGPVRVDFYMFVVFFFQYLCCFCSESDAKLGLRIRIGRFVRIGSSSTVILNSRVLFRFFSRLSVVDPSIQFL
jgi:hypothetical protein